MSEEIERMRFDIREADDRELVEPGECLHFSFSISVSNRGFVSRKCFQKHMEELVRQYVEDVMYEERC